ncbi:MAG: DUF1156 domain-containing protein [Selenomonadaceae bacterium]|nr:DUF1156 domain-containing protein [Selenomonadaceae bacterium]
MKRKLIEVAIPLEAINKASAKEKSIRHGHPSTLHLWWARRPLATARAVLFASLVDDPSEHPDKFPTPEAQQKERERLFNIIKEIVKWENSNNEELFNTALEEIKKSVGDKLPAVLDPFAGGGAIPLEAQRLGLKAFASDLNPVAITINKAMIELPAKFKNQPPVSKSKQGTLGNEVYAGTDGLAADILYYGNILKSLAYKEIGNLYPKVHVPELNTDATVIAWLWARTVTCSNPICRHHMPLVHSFKISSKQNTFVNPVVDGDKIRFQICHGKNVPKGTVNRNGARCLFCGSNVPLEHIRSEGKAGRMSAQLMAIVAQGKNCRIYLPPNEEHEKIATDVPLPDDYPDTPLPDKALGFSVQNYGMTEWYKLFSNRQLTALTTFSDLISEVKEQIQVDGGSADYANAVAVYLAFLVDKLADYNSNICSWNNSGEKLRNTFGLPIISMTWDFAETNPFSNSSGCFDNMLNWIYKSVKELPAKIPGEVNRHSALQKFSLPEPIVVSTDPPYYDNIGYANLSEFFYVWLQRNLIDIYPELFGLMTFEKNEELIAEPARFENNKTTAKEFFESGMSRALKNIYDCSRDDFPVTIYYAFRQQESDIDGDASTGWETMLAAIIKAGFQITATWPMRTELSNRMRSLDSNALASSIVFACRKRLPENKFCSRTEFIDKLKTELKISLDKMQKAMIAPVDMAQAAIGPGIAVYSRYDKITDMNDNPVTIRDALKIINAALAEFFGSQTGQLDAASQFCVDLFTQCCFDVIDFGDADILARAKNISVKSLEDIRAVTSERGSVSLRNRDEIPILQGEHQLNKEWIKTLVDGKCIWLWVQTLVKVFANEGIDGSADLLKYFEGDIDSIRNLGYQLYNISERKNLAEEAKGYNDFVNEWQSIFNRRNELMRKETKPVQGELSLPKS